MKHGPKSGSLVNPYSHCSRRSFLLYNLIGILGLGAGGCQQSASWQDAWLMEASPYPEEAANIGRAYLASYPNERNREMLIMKINEALRMQAGVNTSQEYKKSFVNLDQLIRQEYASGKMVIIQGWVLSPTEARLYAIFSLL